MSDQQVKAGARERFNTEVVTLGRHPLSNLRFVPQVDLDVSVRHAELRESDGEWSINDLQSTNGTYVNSERITGTRVLATGDLVRLGVNGPQVEVQIGGRTSGATVADAKRVSTEPPARRTPPGCAPTSPSGGH